MSMTRFAVIASLTALIGCAPSDGIRTDNAEARELYRQGGVFQARRAGRADADLAAARFRAAVEADKDFAQGWAALAQASMWLEFNQGVQGQRAIAESALERAVALEPDAVETRLARGYIAYWGYRDYPAALEAFLAADEQSPDDPDIAGAVGNIYRRQGRLDDAIRYYERRAELNPSHPQAHTTLAGTYAANGQYADILTEADRLLELNDGRGHIWRFWAHLHSGDTAAAWAALPEIRSTANADGPGFFDVVRATMRRDDAALSVLVDSIGFDIGGGLRFEVSHYLWRSGQIARGSAAMEGWISDFEEELDASTASEAMGVVQEANLRSLLALHNAFLGNRRVALAEASRAVELQPENADAWVAGGILGNVYTVYIGLGQTDRALDVLTELMDDWRGPSAGWAEMHPSYDGLREDARFEAAVQARRSIEKPVM